MILEHLKETKEDHDIDHEILDAKIDKCNDDIHRIFTALETIAKEKDQKQGQEIQNHISKCTYNFTYSWKFPLTHSIFRPLILIIVNLVIECCC